MKNEIPCYGVILGRSPLRNHPITRTGVRPQWGGGFGGGKAPRMEWGQGKPLRRRIRFSWPHSTYIRFTFGVRGVAPHHEMTGRGGSSEAGRIPDLWPKNEGINPYVTGFFGTFSPFNTNEMLTKDAIFVTFGELKNHLFWC